MKSLLYSKRKKKPIIKRPINGKSEPRELTKDTKCHLDPDIRKGVITYHEHKDWKPLFGQVEKAQSYLKDTAKVKENDIFLFYGRFEKTEGKDNRHLKFVPEDGFHTGRHIIYGYLQVGEIKPLDEKTKLSREQDWMKYHPHLCLNEYKKFKDKQTNTVYIASNSLGGGTFKFKNDGNLVLTKKGHCKSHWDLIKLFDRYLKPDEVKMLKLLENGKDIMKNNSNNESYYKSNRFQERVLKVRENVNKSKKEHILGKLEEWAIDLIKNYDLQNLRY